jgi:hypothetical protein
MAQMATSRQESVAEKTNRVDQSKVEQDRTEQAGQGARQWCGSTHKRDCSGGALKATSGARSRSDRTHERDFWCTLVVASHTSATAG